MDEYQSNTTPEISEAINLMATEPEAPVSAGRRVNVLDSWTKGFGPRPSVWRAPPRAPTASTARTKMDAASAAVPVSTIAVPSQESIERTNEAREAGAKAAATRVDNTQFYRDKVRPQLAYGLTGTILTKIEDSLSYGPAQPGFVIPVETYDNTTPEERAEIGEARNPEHLSAILGRQQVRREDMQALAAHGPGQAIVASLTAGVLDPTNVVAGVAASARVAYRTAEAVRAGQNISRARVVGDAMVENAYATLATTGLQSVMDHHTTGTDIVVDMAAGGVLSVLGLPLALRGLDRTNQIARFNRIRNAATERQESLLAQARENLGVGAPEGAVRAEAGRLDAADADAFYRELMGNDIGDRRLLPDDARPDPEGTTKPTTEEGTSTAIQVTTVPGSTDVSHPAWFSDAGRLSRVVLMTDLVDPETQRFSNEIVLNVPGNPAWDKATILGWSTADGDRGAGNYIRVRNPSGSEIDVPLSRLDPAWLGDADTVSARLRMVAQLNNPVIGMVDDFQSGVDSWAKLGHNSMGEYLAQPSQDAGGTYRFEDLDGRGVEVPIQTIGDRNTAMGAGRTYSDIVGTEAQVQFAAGKSGEMARAAGQLVQTAEWLAKEFLPPDHKLVIGMHKPGSKYIGRANGSALSLDRVHVIALATGNENPMTTLIHEIGHAIHHAMWADSAFTPEMRASLTAFHRDLLRSSSTPLDGSGGVLKQMHAAGIARRGGQASSYLRRLDVPDEIYADADFVPTMQDLWMDAFRKADRNDLTPDRTIFAAYINDFQESFAEGFVKHIHQAVHDNFPGYQGEVPKSIVDWMIRASKRFIEFFTFAKESGALDVDVRFRDVLESYRAINKARRADAGVLAPTDVPPSQSRFIKKRMAADEAQRVANDAETKAVGLEAEAEKLKKPLDDAKAAAEDAEAALIIAKRGVGAERLKIAQANNRNAQAKLKEAQTAYNKAAHAATRARDDAKRLADKLAKATEGALAAERAAMRSEVILPVNSLNGLAVPVPGTVPVQSTNGAAAQALSGAQLRTFQSTDNLSKKYGLDMMPLRDAAEEAEYKAVRALWAKVDEWQADNPRDMSVQSRLLDTALFQNGASATATLLKSNNPLARMIASELLESANGAGGRRSTAAIGKYLAERRMTQNVIPEVEAAYGDYRRAKGYGLVQDRINGKAWEQFNREVAIEIESRRTGAKPTEDPSVRAAADSLEATFERIRKEQLQAKTVGWAALPETSRGYMPHRMNPIKVRELTNNQSRAVIAALERQFVAIEGFDPAFSKGLAQAYFDRMRQRALGSEETPMNIHHTGAADVIEDALTAMGMTKMQIRQTMERYTRGGAAHTKQRLDLDLLEDMGDGAKLIDLYSTDMLSLARNQAGRVSGEVSLAPFGIMGSHGMRLVRRAMEFGGDSEKISPREIESFDQVTAEFLHQPFGTIGSSKALGRVVQVTALARLGGMGFTQIAETINLATGIGVGKALGAVPSLLRLRNEAKALAAGQPVTNPILTSVEKFSGVTFGTDNRKMVFPMDDPNLERQIYSSTAMNRFDRLLRGGGYLQGRLSFWRSIQGAQQRAAAEGIVRKAMEFVLSGADDVALNDMGINAAMRARLKAELPRIAKFENGALTEFDLTKIGDVTLGNEFVQTVHRGTFQLIQDTFIGERSKWAHDDLMRVFTQFRTFSLTAVEKQWGRNYNNRGLVGALGILLGSMAAALPIYIARTYLNSTGRDDQQEYLDKALTPYEMGRATLNYVASSGLAGDFLDALVSVTGAAEPLGARHGGGAGGVLGTLVAPGAGLVDDAYKAIQNTKDGTDPTGVLKVLPFNRTPFLVPAINMLDAAVND